MNSLRKYGAIELTLPCQLPEQIRWDVRQETCPNRFTDKGTVEASRLTDTLLFWQGYSKGARVGRGLLHATADVLTIGMWEALGTPIELIADGDEVQVDVRYDQDKRVSSISRRHIDQVQMGLVFTTRSRTPP